MLDIIAIPKISKFYHVVNTGKKLKPTEISKEDAKDKLCKVVGKRYISGGKVQLSLHDGRNVAIERKDSEKYGVGDSLVIEVPSQKISSALKIEKGATCYVALGRHAGQVAKLVELEEKPFGTPTDAVLEDGKHKFITRKDYLFVVPKEFKV